MSNMNSQPTPLEEPVFSAPTVEDAVRAGLLELGLDEAEAEVKVLHKGSRGFLGIGSRTAQVQLLPKTRLEPVVLDLARGLLQRMGIQAEVTARQVGLSVDVHIESGETDGLLIGRKGETLEAFQHVLLRMAGQQLSGRIQAVRVDVAGYRGRREEQLKKQVQELAERVERTGRRAMTEPLTPGERRMVHRILADNTRIRTHSGGSGVHQRVIITPGRRPRQKR